MIFNTGSGGNATRIVTGKSLHLADTAGGKYKNIKLVGASVQNGTPAVSKPVDIVSNKVKSITGCGNNFINVKANTGSTTNGLSVSVESGYIITVSGKSSETWANLSDYDTKQIPQGRYTFSIDKSPTELGVGKIGIKFRKSMSDSTIVTHLITGSNKSITFDRLNDYELIQIYADGIDTLKSYNFTIKVILNVGETALLFEEYKGITAELDQTYELNGINGVYDEIDLERGVRIQRFGVKVFKGLDNEGWVGSSYLNGRYGININAKASGICMCSMAINKLVETVNCCHINQSGSFYINTSFNDVAEWKAHLTQNNMTLVYELAEPIETPLSVDELIAFNKLRAYKSGSTLFSGCDMEVEYFLNNKVGQPMADVHLNTAKYILDGATLNIIV